MSASQPPVEPPIEPRVDPPRPALRAALWFFGVLLFAGAIVGVDAWWQLNTPLRISAPTAIEFTLGQTFNSQLRAMERAGEFDSFRQRVYLSLYARLHGDARLARAGEYALDAGLTPLDLLTLLKSGKVILHELRLIEGWRFAQAWKLLQDEPALAHTVADPQAAMAALGRAGQSPEGRFFPDTYRFPRHTPELVILRQAAAASDKLLAGEWATRGENLPYATPDQALVMASIIEKETAVPAERAAIAGVFVRRLRAGMRLQTDPAVIYGIGESFDGNLRARDLTTDTPYNTYLREGLPPTPICLPGRESLHAALHPAPGDALYFVSRGDGTHQFSATLEEHNAAVRRYQLHQSP